MYDSRARVTGHTVGTQMTKWGIRSRGHETYNLQCFGRCSLGIVPPLPVWGISMQGCLASQRGQHTDAMERNHHGKSTVTVHQGRTSSSPPTSYSSDKEKMPPPEHGQHVSHA